MFIVPLLPAGFSSSTSLTSSVWSLFSLYVMVLVFPGATLDGIRVDTGAGAGAGAAAAWAAAAADELGEALLLAPAWLDPAAAFAFAAALSAFVAAWLA